ncbi:DUF3006 domain-containing protein [Clostridium polynesiense]|uniref:DUF3006 domain-containing protein n=1 Tax=Clostridium polynesiense TaxID=1325933 RepID=UPI0005903EB3|nr:DUF3006 domain-containing protein [Clostridium polynesiense]
MLENERLIVDRIEEKLVVVCEDSRGNIVNIDRMQVDGEVKEGDILILKDGKYKVDKESTLKRKNEMENLMKGMWVEDEK